VDGVLNIAKPPGMTSFDVVAEVRRIYGERRVGHSGTLDPAAAGVLPVFLGRAVRLAEFVTDRPKSYRAEMVLGVTTPTYDLTAQPVACAGASAATLQDVKRAAQAFVGKVEQTVPGYSAVKVHGKRLYEMAREGKETPPLKRTVEIISLEILSMSAGEYPRVLLDVRCSKGTYVRALCHDIGQRLGLGAAMAFLVRTASGPFSIEQSRTLEEVRAGAEEALLPSEAAMAGRPAVRLKTDQSAERLCNGVKPSPVEISGLDALGPGEVVGVFSPGGRLLAVGEAARGTVIIRKVLC
jgi:tRNA pseudouridine55 synthase